MRKSIVVFNAGSTSVKFGIYGAQLAADNGEMPLMVKGQIDSMQGNPHFVISDAEGKKIDSHEWGDSNTIDHQAAMHFIIAWLHTNLPDTELIAGGHRIVLGGMRFEEPVLIDEEKLKYLDSLSAMEPSHQPFNIAGARAFASAFPGLPQVACFDTSFHRSMPEVAQIYALPKNIRDEGVRRWGYHGISYDYISRQLPLLIPQARRVIVAHLGGGASMCAMLDGHSIETTMGFDAISGLPMATRPGDVSAGALFYLLRTNQFDASALEKMLYEQSGMLGLSGISGDMRVLQESTDEQAKVAIDYFAYTMMKYIGAYTAVLGGLDAIVFTAGIGENSTQVRAALCEKLAWLDVRLDENINANVEGAQCISTADSKVSVWVIPTNEELMIAQYALELVS